MAEKSELVQRRGRVKGILTRMKTFAENITAATSIEEINIRLQKVDEVWAEFQDIEDSLLLIDDQMSEMTEYEEKYYDIKVSLTRATKSRAASAPANDSSISDQLSSTMNQFLTQQQTFLQSFDRTASYPQGTPRLPKLNIPVFSGEYKEWISFQDLFEASIHSNPVLTGSQKLQYLKGLLSGQAANVIRHLKISESNYSEAWDSLKKRFDKRSHITSSLIKTYFDITTAIQPSVKLLRNATDTFDEVLRGLRALGNEAEKRDPWLIYIALTKLDSETRQLWSQEVANKDFPTFTEFLEFLSKRCNALETCGVINKRSLSLVKTLHTYTSTEAQVKCSKCSNNHPIYKCEKFKADSPENRRSFVVERALCFRCLGSTHSVKTCRSKLHCFQCKGNHHHLLHLSRNTASPKALARSQPEEEALQTNSLQAVSCIMTPVKSLTNYKAKESDLSNTLLKEQTYQVMNENESKIHLLPTVLSKVFDSQGRLQPIRMLLDSGSQVSLISEPCAQRLNLKRRNARITISGLQSSCVGTTRGKTELKIFSKTKEFNIKVKAFIMSKLTSLIPSKNFVLADWKKLCNVDLADPSFNKPSSIDVILGADYFFEILKEGKIYGRDGGVIAQNSSFGWIVCGGPLKYNSSVISLSSNLVDLDKTLRLFWETEELPKDISSLTVEESECESHFKKHVSRNEKGRFIVSLPFKEDTFQLGESKQAALKRLQAMERKFERDNIFKNQYSDFMQEYFDLGHMELILREELEPNAASCFYLPHHAVFKNSPIPKIRVVFDGSCKSSSGISLNEKLLVGPVVQRDLISILLSFRKHAIGFSADIEKMYRQILVASEDTNFQRILWRSSSANPIQSYRLTTVTYGTSSAPFLATRVLNQISEDNFNKYPEASIVLRNDFYVDDLLSGCDSLEAAVKIKTDLCHILKASGFKLTKWQSNIPELLNVNGNTDKIMEIDSKDETVKVLGIHWNPSEDVFSFSISSFDSGGVSKRIILSESSRIFDPLGWLAPVVVLIKILLQSLWVLKCGWDDSLPDHIVKKWENFKADLSTLSKIKIPRRIYYSITNIHLHGFADASEDAYGAVVYCISTDSHNNLIARIVAAKSRVSPIQQVTLPRLELCAALLLVRLMEKIKQTVEFKQVTVHAWTDSTVVLTWLSDIPRRWKNYVANRTAEILQFIPRAHWRYVPSKNNPADLVTRGISAKELALQDLWWNGPKWLRESSDAWPKDISTGINSLARKEERKLKVLLTCTQDISDEDIILHLTKRVSSFHKLIRILAYCLRLKTKPGIHSRLISTSELHNSTKICLRRVQQSAFSSELRDIKMHLPVSSKSPIARLTPFIDESGILRVGGRLQKSTHNFNAKHPAIIPRHHPLSEMLVRELHKLYLHPGPSLLIGITRQRYWILGIRDIARKICKSCMICFKHRAARSTQLMGSLPEARVIVSRPFYNVGIDYAGPVSIYMRVSRGAKPLKAYIALFVCLATKALHLELVSSLTSEAFVAALRRFVSRRGIPAKIFSDNGTNFVGGKRYINELHELVLKNSINEDISHFLAKHAIQWSFIPPGAPHFGGLWEAGVKSVKWHLRRVIGETILSFEEMTTLLTQIEAVLNSRPYGNMSSNPDDLDALTPSHFLIGEPLTTLPEPDYSEVKINRLGRWQHLQAMVQGFWKRWRIEYLTTLQERSKWRTEEKPLQEGELVIINEDHLPPTKWSMGRVIQTHPGSDGLVRVVSLRTSRGVIKRTISKVYKLPIS